MPHPPRFGLFISQQYHDWPSLVEHFQLAEELGFDYAWVYDHFISMRDGIMGPTMEAWTLLAGLAAATSRIGLGTMVTGNTYRPPALLAKQVVTVDHISNGRAILGVGAGWHEGEHEMFGIPFPSAGERVERFHEALQIFRQLTSQERTTFVGRHYQIKDAPFEPKPVQPQIPLLIGTKGSRMLRLTARYADIWDANSAPTDPTEGDAAAKWRELAGYCRAIGRDPESLRRSIWSRTAIQSEDEFRRFVTGYQAHGFTDFSFTLARGMDLNTVRRIGETIVPELRQAGART